MVDYNLSEKPETKKVDYGYTMPDFDSSEDQLLKISINWDKESEEYHSKLEKIWQINEAYYKGRQTKLEMIPANFANTVQNHIFMGIETIIPIITANSPKFVAEPAEDSDTAIRYANNIGKALSIIYEEKDIRTKGEMLIRHMMIYRFGAWIPFFDDESKSPDVKWVRPHRIFFPETNKLFYYYEKKEYTADEFKDEFGEEEFKKFLESKGSVADPSYGDSQGKEKHGRYIIKEYHTKDITFRKCQSYIFSKEKNNTYNHEDEEKNFFDGPKLPIIIASNFRLGSEPIGETDLITQTIPIQDTINVTNRLIINNATKMGNAPWLVDAETMTEEESRAKINNAPGQVIWGNGVANPNKLRRESPPALPNYIAELKLMAERAFDNIFGTHSTTRGERGESETLGGRMLLKQSDYGRIDLLVREYERCVAELGNWFTQLNKMHLTAERVYRASGEAGDESVKISDTMIEKGLKVIIKSGTTLPTDEVSKRQEAMELAAMGLLDPVTLFERLKFPNPQDAAEKLQAWKMGQLQMEAQVEGTRAQPRENKVRPEPTGRGMIGNSAKNLANIK